MASRADFGNFLSNMFNIFQAPQQFNIGDDASQHVNKLTKYIVDMKIVDENEKLRIFVNSLEQNAQYEIFSLPEYDSVKANFDGMILSFLDLYKIKESKVSPIIDLLHLKQNHLPLREYMTRLRVELYKSRPSLCSEEREKTLIFAFLYGLQNRKAAAAVEFLKPRTLDEAHKFAKKEVKNGEVETCLQIKDPSSNLIEEIQILRRKVDDLEKMVMELTKSNMRQYSYGGRAIPGRQPEKRNLSHITCFNCDSVGHLVRDCKKPIICKFCKKAGHLERFCKTKKQTAFRYMKDDETTQSSNSINNDQASEDQSIETNYAITNKDSRERTKKASNGVVTRQIRMLDQFIQGQGNKPRSVKKANTLISKNHSELARNKPLVKANIYGKSVSTLIDSGAESNIMDAQLFQEIKAKNKKIKLYERRGKLVCANGSTMEILGTTKVDIQIGEQSMKMIFKIVENLFPRLIIGIKSMKEHRIQIVPQEDCIYVKNDPVSFISKVVSSKSEN